MAYYYQLNSNRLTHWLTHSLTHSLTHRYLPLRIFASSTAFFSCTPLRFLAIPLRYVCICLFVWYSNEIISTSAILAKPYNKIQYNSIQHRPLMIIDWMYCFASLIWWHSTMKNAPSLKRYAQQPVLDYFWDIYFIWCCTKPYHSIPNHRWKLLIFVIRRRMLLQASTTLCI